MTLNFYFYLCLALWGADLPLAFNRSAFEFTFGTVGIVCGIYWLTVKRHGR